MAPPARPWSRRRFAAGVAVGASATLLPQWLARAFGLDEREHLDAPPDDCPAPELRAPLGPSCVPSETTDPSERPLLVLVIPRDPAARWDRGYAWGAYLNHGQDPQLAPLSLFQVVCAGIDAVPDLGGARLEGEPWMVIIDRQTGRTIPVDVEPQALPQDDDTADAMAQDWESRRRDENAAEEARVAEIARALAAAAAPMLDEWAAQERTRIDANECGRIDATLASGEPMPPALLDRAAAQVLRTIRDAPETPLAWSAELLLAESVRRRLVWVPIAGSRWAQGAGCGIQIEGEEPHMMACGMGHVPPLSRRFLYFFTDDER